MHCPALQTVVRWLMATEVWHRSADGDRQMATATWRLGVTLKVLIAKHAALNAAIASGVEDWGGL